MIATLDASAERLRRRVAGAVLLRALALHAAFALVAGGIGALVAREALGLSRLAVAWAFAPLLLAPVSAWLVARSRTLSRAGAIAWLDVRTGAGGALLTSDEVGDAPWNARWKERLERALARDVALPRARLARPALELCGALAFACACLWIDVPDAAPAPARALQQAAVERLEEKLETLREEAQLDEELDRELEARLERAQDPAAAPEEAYEALDRVEERLTQAGEELADELERARESLAAARGAADSDPEAAQKALEETLRQLSDAGLGRNLPEELARELGGASLELPEGAALDASKLGALSSELREALAAKLARLDAAGLAKLGKLGRPGERGDRPGLEGFEPTGHVCDASCEKKPGGT